VEGLDLPIDEAALDARAEVLAADPSALLAVLSTFEAALKTLPSIAFLSKLKSPIKNSSYSVIILAFQNCI
jgi:hypothetical protein